MTDRELKKKTKKLIIVSVLVFFLILFISAYTLGSTKANLSVCEDTDKYQNTLLSMGIDEEELKQYLSMFGNLVNKEGSEDEKSLNMATYFVDNMYSFYEGDVKYSATTINKIIEETQGKYIKKNLDGGTSYTYNADQNEYKQNVKSETIPYCVEIENVSKNGEKLDVRYKLAEFTEEEIAKYLTDKDLDIQTVSIKVSIMLNKDYEFSKYFINKIEKQ